MIMIMIINLIMSTTNWNCES